MNDFKKRNKFGGGEKGDRRGGNFGKKDFNRSHFGGDRGRTTELFDATCAACGKTCQVPFRPNGKKPVYCKECFDRNSGNGNSFAPRPSAPSYKQERSEYRPAQQPDNGMHELKRQMESVNAKLDTLISIMSAKATSASQEPSKESAEEKKPAKKSKTKKTK